MISNPSLLVPPPPISLPDNFTSLFILNMHIWFYESIQALGTTYKRKTKAEN